MREEELKFRWGSRKGSWQNLSPVAGGNGRSGVWDVRRTETLHQGGVLMTACVHMYIPPTHMG